MIFASATLSLASSAERASGARRAALFLVICSPLWLAPRAVWQGYPFTLPAVLGLTLLFLRWDGRRGDAIGLNFSLRRASDLICGTAAAALLVAAIASLIALILPFPWQRNPRFQGMVAMFSFLSLLYGNSVEELIFRGYSFDKLIAAIGHWKAQLVTAILFAVFHIANGWPWHVAVFGTTIGSLLFGLVFVRWQSVPAAAGVHAGANWMRDLVLLDPPAPATLFGPLAPRPWTHGEQLATALVWNGVILLVCAVLWRSIYLRQRSTREPAASPPSTRPGDRGR